MRSLDPYLLALVVLAALGCGLVAGLLLAFSTAVMKALCQLPPEQGIRAMQHINVIILNPMFLGIFLGTALLSAVLAVTALLYWPGPGTSWMLIGAVSYLVGTFAVTMTVNVPLNNRLAATDASSKDGPSIWAAYVEKWLGWNHLRTLMAAVAALAFTLSAACWQGPAG